MAGARLHPAYLTEEVRRVITEVKLDQLDVKWFDATKNKLPAPGSPKRDQEVAALVNRLASATREPREAVIAKLKDLQKQWQAEKGAGSQAPDEPSKPADKAPGKPEAKKPDADKPASDKPDADKGGSAEKKADIAGAVASGIHRVLSGSREPVASKNGSVELPKADLRNIDVPRVKVEEKGGSVTVTWFIHAPGLKVPTDKAQASAKLTKFAKAIQAFVHAATMVEGRQRVAPSTMLLELDFAGKSFIGGFANRTKNRLTGKPADNKHADEQTVSELMETFAENLGNERAHVPSPARDGSIRMPEIAVRGTTLHNVMLKPEARRYVLSFELNVVSDYDKPENEAAMEKVAAQATNDARQLMKFDQSLGGAP